MSKAAGGAKEKQVEPQVHIVQKVIGGDTYLVMSDSALQMEDEFSNLYFSTQSSSNVVIQPPFEPKVLARLPNLNNILSQCIEAMEVNVDGTGHEFMPLDEEGKIDETELAAAKAFFSEPYPNKSFIQLRRKLRRDVESIGFGFLEVLSTATGEIAAVRNTEGHLMRYVKLDEAVLVSKTMTRNGSEIEMKMWERERRFVQKVGTKMVYYREFGTSREVNRETGEWAEEGTVLAADKRGTELLVFGVNPDVGTPYFVPRWINQLPSVLGSRKAEEANLEFFDAGGMPPAIIFVQGGTLAKTASDQLRGYLSGQAKNRQRAVVVEAQSTSGNLEGSNAGVQIKVERFGSEATNDAMYQNYDKAAEDHIRSGFRLPKLFLGRSDDYNYATAVVAYMVAEEQVFRPERLEFDEVINKTLLKSLGFKTLRYVSKPITLKNVEHQLKAIEMLKGLVKEEDYVAEVTAVGGIALSYDKATADESREMAKAQLEAQKNQLGQQGQQPPKPGEKPVAKPTETPITREPAKATVKTELMELAVRYAGSRGILTQKMEMSEQDLADLAVKMDALHGQELEMFNTLIASWAFGSADKDLVDLAGCCH